MQPLLVQAVREGESVMSIPKEFTADHCDACAADVVTCDEALAIVNSPDPSEDQHARLLRFIAQAERDQASLRARRIQADSFKKEWNAAVDELEAENAKLRAACEAPAKELLAQSEQIHALREENAKLRAACEAALELLPISTSYTGRWKRLIAQLQEALGIAGKGEGTC
jgi:chromosome segregation ATPase